MAAVLFFNLQTNQALANEEKDSFWLDQFIVTATQTPIDKREVNGEITVLTRADLEKGNYHNLVEALRGITGVTSMTYGTGVGTEISGGNRPNINGTFAVAVVVDGVRQNLLGSYRGNLATLNINDIERIEVLRGSASVLYGADAIGGVINIITRKERPMESKATIEYGSYDARNFRLYNGGAQDGYYWSAMVEKKRANAYKDADNVRIPQDLDANAYNFKIGKKINKYSDLVLSYSKYETDNIYSEGYRKADIPLPSVFDWYNLSLIHTYNKDDKERNQFSILHNSLFGERHADPKLDFDEVVKTTGFVIQDQYYNRLSDKHTLAAGFEWIKWNDKKFGSNMVSVDRIDRSIYLQDEWKFVDKWKFTAGVRYNKFYTYDSYVNDSFSLSYKPDERTNLYVSSNSYFTAPTFTQLFGNSSTKGNRDLKPEDGRTHEIGIYRQFDKSIEGSVNFFKRVSDNAITKQTINGVSQYANSESDLEFKGWSVSLNKQLSPYFKAKAGYTHFIPSSKTDFSNIPNSMFNLSLDYEKARFSAQLVANAVYDINRSLYSETSGDRYLPEYSYWVWNVNMNYKLNKQTKVFFKVNNLFDKYYAERTNVSKWYTEHFGAGDWWSAPGRNFIIGVDYLF